MSGQVNLEALLRTVDCYRNVTRVRNDVLMCTTQMRNLVPKVEKLMHNNGMESRLLVLGGTVPMVYAGAQYNIPVEIYISEPYPDAPPRCYVRPTREMELKMGHRHVDREGLVYLPYLHEWNARTHNLLELCGAMSSVFSQDPPVFSTKGRPPAQPAQSYPTVGAYGGPGASTGAYAYGAATADPSRLQPPPPSYDSLARPPYPSTGMPGAYARPPQQAQLEVRRRDAVQQVTAKTQRALQEFYAKVRVEIDEEYERQGKLQEGRQKVTGGMAQLKKLKEELQQRISALADQEHQLDAWLAEQSGKAEVHVDDAVDPADAPSRQMLELVANNAALEDALYHLDKAVASGAIDLASFLKKVRELSREQFLCVAHINKIYRAQQAQIVATRPVQPGAAYVQR